ncbi:extracellular solute-binding protein [Spirochaeta isovalerica]|uniref:Putative aldouronate transport system substrate-binding protein n=1 Tax=Spirochaeta isovalerica TaxID=150 RepID=A0A841RDZ4_9SPIO|nr:extracellular solute-binding protein [Spirochaeta isovalerica]MBB6481220.1 putative aldouronate transport system substrate-binding protein [Spirochaeta isovalerica]
MKRIIPPLLLIFLVTACGSGDIKKEEPYRFTAYLDNIIQDWEGQKVFIEEFNRLTGMELDIVQPPHQQYMEKLMVSFSGKDSPELCEILPEYLSLLVSREIALPLDKYIENSIHVSHFDDEFLDNLRSHDGHIYGFPARDGGGCVTYIRKDWLDNLGLEIPRTWEQFHNVLRAFTYDDPDENGLDDTRGYTDVNSGAEDWYNRAIMLDGRVEIYWKNGAWVDGFTEPAATAALERLKTIYQEGLVDPNIVTNTTFTARNRFINGDVGVFTYWGNHWARNLLERTGKVSGPEVELVAIPPLDDGYYIKRVAPLLVITSDTEEPGKVFSSFIDRQYDKGEIQTLFTYGVKGYHWDFVDGEPRFLINQNDPYKVLFTKSFVPPTEIINDWDQPMRIDEVIVPVQETLNSNSRQEKIKFGKANYDRYYLEIERSLKPDIISRIINGGISIEEGLSEYRRKAAELSLDKILDELNGKI